MPWREVTRVSLREEFVKLASSKGANRRELCRRFGISAKTGYKWLARFKEQGAAGLRDGSRRPHRSPRRTASAIELMVVKWRAESGNCWGGRKIRRLLTAQGVTSPPAPSTVTGILRRYDLLAPQAYPRPLATGGFERALPNELWQMDFKGDFELGAGRCYPLTVLDDHSRFALAVKACANQRRDTVQEALAAVFRRYGLPWAMLMDNGPPWGAFERGSLTELSLWLIRLQIRVIHSRPYHPQTQGKDERFHRTLKLEALNGRRFNDLGQCQREFDRFRDRYNLLRPHQALALEVPASRYRPSPRPFPESLPPIDYPSDLLVRKVQAEGWFSFRGTDFRVSKALRGYPVALRPADLDQHCYDVFFCHQRIAQINFNQSHQCDSPPTAAVHKSTGGILLKIPEPVDPVGSSCP